MHIFLKLKILFIYLFILVISLFNGEGFYICPTTLHKQDVMQSQFLGRIKQNCSSPRLVVIPCLKSLFCSLLEGGIDSYLSQ